MKKTIYHDGIGEPVTSYKKPATAKYFPSITFQVSDEFNFPSLSLQGQWSTNPDADWGFPATYGYFYLNAVPYPRISVNMWEVPNLFLQKFTAPSFNATARILFHPHDEKDKAGLIVMGTDYSYLPTQKSGRSIGAKAGFFFCVRKDVAHYIGYADTDGFWVTLLKNTKE